MLNTSVSSISLSGQKAVTFDFGKTGANPDPSKKYVDIYVTGDVSMKGGGSQTDGSIVIVNGVYVTMYVGGNMDVGGNGLVNNNGNAASLSIYGITPPAGVSRTFSLGGSATFYGTVYAPGADLVLNGGGTAGSSWEASRGRQLLSRATCKSATMSRLDKRRKRFLRVLRLLLGSKIHPRTHCSNDEIIATAAKAHRLALTEGSGLSMGVGLGSMGVGLGLGVPAGANTGVGLVGPFREEAVGEGVACAFMKASSCRFFNSSASFFPAAFAGRKGRQAEKDDRYNDVLYHPGRGITKRHPTWVWPRFNLHLIVL